MNRIIRFFFLIFIVLVFPPKAYAYLDPGTGSYFFQILIGIVIGGLVSIKIFWKKIKDFFNGKKEN
ncbi:hypothetical protein HYU45_02675 [Candidatus Daviesbacteria bacterium]|nr:hypothetical protein [Candidatus Daviesbacteria bacterium]